MKYKLSPSSINLMMECQRCFWQQLVKKDKRPDTIFPSLPNGLDKILKEHFDRFMLKGQLPPELTNGELGEGYKLFNDKEKLDVWRNNYHGIQYKDEKNGILLRGAIDNLLEKDRKLVVIDYKTRGFPLKEDTHTHYQTQLDLYNFLLRKNDYETKDYAYLLFYYPKEVATTGEMIFYNKLVKMPISIENAEKRYKEAVKILDRKKAPEADMNCGFCAYRKK